MSSNLNGSVIDSLFIRNRNVLLARGEFSGLIASIRKHWEAHDLVVKPALEVLFLEGLACFLLHCASRPRNEHLSWTINFQNPLANLLFVGDTRESTVTGRVFDEYVKVAAEQSFFQEFVPARSREVIRSHVAFTGKDVLLAAEAFYEKSEQRPARFFRMGESSYAILSAHPDWDESWFRSVSQEDVSRMDSLEHLVLLEQRLYRWDCGLNKNDLMKIIGPMMENSIDDLFQGDNHIESFCPRCAERFIVTREEAEAWKQSQASVS